MVHVLDALAYPKYAVSLYLFSFYTKLCIFFMVLIFFKALVVDLFLISFNL